MPTAAVDVNVNGLYGKATDPAGSFGHARELSTGGGGVPPCDTVTTAVSRNDPPLCATMTRKDPATGGAMNRPLPLMAPAAAVHVRGGSSVAPVLQVACAVNCSVSPAETDTVLGLIRSDASCAATACTPTMAVSALPHAQFATTRKVPATLPAVNRPVGDTPPPVAE